MKYEYGVKKIGNRWYAESKVLNCAASGTTKVEAIEKLEVAEAEYLKDVPPEVDFRQKMTPEKIYYGMSMRYAPKYR